VNYQKVYDALVTKRIADPAVGYFERHHVLPKALGGSNAKANIVLLTGREHFIAHLLLARIHGGGMWMAVVWMKGRRHGDRYMNGRLYESARQAWATWSRENQRGEKHWAFGTVGKNLGMKYPNRTGEKHDRYGKPMLPHVKAALAAANVGSKRTAECKAKIAAAQTGSKNHSFGKTLTAEHRAKVASAMSKRVLSDEHKQRIGAAHRGMKRSDEAKQKMRDAAARRKAAP